MTKHSKTRAKRPRQRFRCRACNLTMTRPIDTRARELAAFLDHVTSGRRLADLPGGGRTFQRRAEELWGIWPLPPLVEEVHRVVYVDGIHLHRKAVILIARTDEYVLGWHVARREHADAWEALLSRIEAPMMVVCDGGSGFATARRRAWPTTRVQRCTFHVFSNVRTHTTTRPRLEAGVELYGIARALLHVQTVQDQAAWLGEYTAWCAKWRQMLAEKTLLANGDVAFTHQRLVRARGQLNTLVRSSTLFTYLDPALTIEGPLPAMNNRIEATNARLREMLRDHRGWPLIRRIKAIMWWCHQHSEHPASPAEILKVMPTDTQIEAYHQQAHRINADQREHQLRRFGDAIAWHELHKADPYRTDWD